MEYALIIIGLFIILTTYREAKSDNSILSKDYSLRIFSKTIVGGYIIGLLSILAGSLFIYLNYFRI
ncbi:hypothetical protein [Clostridium beijerinckii]|uniref:Uncharacterized protein n=1 Tax=Clostridium beijerinckii TaxID=1520 RepID=A0AAX0BB72_CLOBE|nr:hypothetical protein [Clostridium beijerinckii]NRT92351.1 hypothetical protein [Clostridium beijerinckii]NYC75506.1 hypothetical protein [Clostridium beijerinckii]